MSERKFTEKELCDYMENVKESEHLKTLKDVEKMIEKIKEQRGNEDYSTLSPPHKDCPEGCGDEGLFHQQQILESLLTKLKNADHKRKVPKYKISPTRIKRKGG